MKRDLSLYLVTQRENLSLNEFFKIIVASIEGGVSIVQLREKECSDDEMFEVGRKLQSILKPLGVPLIINDRLEVAKALAADGVHLGQSDPNVAYARAFLGNKSIIGLSVETIEQALNVEDLNIDYVAASPIFSTNTKLNCAKPWGLEGLKQLCSTTRHPVVAIGGVDETNVRQIIECGVVGVAVVSAIFKAKCAKKAALDIIQHKVIRPSRP